MKYSYILHTLNGNITIADNVNPFDVASAKEIKITPYTVQISSKEKGM